MSAIETSLLHTTDRRRHQSETTRQRQQIQQLGVWRWSAGGCSGGQWCVDDGHWPSLVGTYWTLHHRHCHMCRPTAHHCRRRVVRHRHAQL